MHTIELQIADETWEQLEVILDMTGKKNINVLVGQLVLDGIEQETRKLAKRIRVHVT